MAECVSLETVYALHCKGLTVNEIAFALNVDPALARGLITRAWRLDVACGDSVADGKPFASSNMRKPNKL